MNACLLAICLISQDPPEDRPSPVAIVIEVAGRPTRSSAGTTRPIRRLDLLRPGDVVKVGDGEGMTIVFTKDGHVEKATGVVSAAIAESGASDPKGAGKIDRLAPGLTGPDLAAFRDKIRGDDLLAAATRAKAVEPIPASDPKAPASYRLTDPAGLRAVLQARPDALGDDVCDACVLRWRDVPAPQKGFWRQWLRGTAEASGRPRPSGLAGLLEAALLPGDPASQARVPGLQESARDRFHEAKNLAWEAAAENEMGLSALGKDRFDDADARFEAAGKLYAKAFHPRHRLVASTLRNRGNGPAKRQDHASAVHDYRQAADLLDVNDPGSAQERISILQNLSAAYFGQGDMASAVGPIREATEILTRLRGPNDLAIQPFLENLGGIDFSRGEHDRALETAKRAYDIAQAAFGPEDPRVVRYLGTLADRSGRLG